MSRRKYEAHGDRTATGKRRGLQDQLLRRQIACAAAKLIAEEGLTDYLAAKMKAARSLLCNTKEALPDNHEIEAALREHLSIFHRDTQPLELRELRKIAAGVMRHMKRFSPQLHGPVLNGTANRFSSIELDVVVDDEKALDLFFLNENMPYEITPYGAGNSRKQRQTYKFSIDNVRVAATVFMSAAERTQHTVRDGLNISRADLAGVDALLRTS